MTAGWYYADGDPADTVRYWDGTAWHGEPRPAAKSAPPAIAGIELYDTSTDEIDLGDVAKRVTLSESSAKGSYSQSPYSIVQASKSAIRKRRLPEGLKNLTILVCVLKLIPLAGVALGLFTAVDNNSFVGRYLRRAAAPGLDFDAGRTLAITVTLAILVLTVGLLIAQARASINERAEDLFAAAAALVLLDLFAAVDQWAALAQGQSPGQTILATLSFALQAFVTTWAAMLAFAR